MKVRFAAAHGKNDFSVSPVQNLLPLQQRSKRLQDKVSSPKFSECGAHFTLFDWPVPHWICLFRSTSNSLPSVSFRVRSSFSLASGPSSILSTTSLLKKYCFLFAAKRNSGSAARGCWLLCDFAPVNSPWSRLSSAAFYSFCFRSFLAQSGGSDGEREGDREREWWCAEAREDLPRSSPASLERLLRLRLYGCNLFTARDLVRELSFAIKMYYKKTKKNRTKGS